MPRQNRRRQILQDFTSDRPRSQRIDRSNSSMRGLRAYIGSGSAARKEVCRELSLGLRRDLLGLEGQRVQVPVRGIVGSPGSHWSSRARAIVRLKPPGKSSVQPRCKYAGRKAVEPRAGLDSFLLEPTLLP
jgi:hypothetical protein